MAGPAMLAVRHAVERALADIEPGQRVLVACSGGPDSLALAAAAAWVCARAQVHAGAVIVDHGLQEGSAEIAQRAAGQCRVLGLEPVVVRRVEVGGDGGPEMAARIARYTALDDAALELGAVAILLGHTLDDQAETVLLGLARGSGARSLSGMAERDGPLRRPLLGLPRATVHAAAAELGADIGEPWLDPHNADPRYARVRARAMLDALTEALGPGIVPNLARTASLLRDDAEVIDGLVDMQVRMLVTADADGLHAEIQDLEEMQRALRTRLIRRMCISAGSPGEDLTMEHVLAVDRLVTDWHGQGATHLPGGVRAERGYGRLTVRPRDGANTA